MAPKNMPREVCRNLVKHYTKRADIEMKKHTVDSVKAVAEIMQSTAVEPEVRLKAAQFLIERNLGKTPQVISIQASAPWEEIFDEIVNERPRAIEAESVLDVEVVSTKEKMEPFMQQQIQNEIDRLNRENQSIQEGMNETS